MGGSKSSLVWQPLGERYKILIFTVHFMPNTNWKTVPKLGCHHSKCSITLSLDSGTASRPNPADLRGLFGQHGVGLSDMLTFFNWPLLAQQQVFANIFDCQLCSSKEFALLLKIHSFKLIRDKVKHTKTCWMVFPVFQTAPTLDWL